MDGQARKCLYSKVLLKQNYNESNKEKENTKNKNWKTYKKQKIIKPTQ